jgi:hypothetical protein
MPFKRPVHLNTEQCNLQLTWIFTSGLADHAGPLSEYLFSWNATHAAFTPDRQNEPPQMNAQVEIADGFKPSRNWETYFWNLFKTPKIPRNRKDFQKMNFVNKIIDSKIPTVPFSIHQTSYDRTKSANLTVSNRQGKNIPVKENIFKRFQK